jgi:hypothetical protein
MVTTSRSNDSQHGLARQVRERFVKALDSQLPDLMAQVQALLLAHARGEHKSASMAQMQLAMDAARLFQAQRHHWIEAVRKGWRDSLTDMAAAAAVSRRPTKLSFALEDGDVAERKILASRLASAVAEAAGPDINNLKLRIQRLERASDWSAQDVLRPDALPLELVKAWGECGFTQPMWALALPALQPAVAKHMADAYRQANEFLIENGVMAEIDFKDLVRRDRPSGWGSDTGPGAGAPHDDHHTGRQHPGPGMRRDPQAGWAPPPPARPAAPAWGGAPAQAGRQPGMQAAQPREPSVSRMDDYTRQGPATETPYVRHSALARAAQETRMMTGVTPMARMRERAQGVLGQLRRFLSDRVTDFDAGGGGGGTIQPSPQLARALAEPPTPFAVTELMERTGTGAGSIGQMPGAQVAAVASQLRKRATELKAKAEKPSEKAIIEIVALMFQAILAEERIPPTIRVWFARLQIPVLRLALAEPDFFASVQHPARQLIDRMGGCALGFDVAQVNGSRLEREIKRIVQVIEQYPETGRRVYQLVLDEFKKFLGRSLTEGGAVQQAASLAQQVEQKEALSIQYTIELRRMLAPVPVGEDVREFLFRIWSEVLAMAAVRRGPQHADTLRFKQAAADLLWAVSPRSDRAERSRVVQKLAGVIAVLREGMGSIGMASDEQDGHVKLLNDAVMQAFVSRAESIAQSTLDDLARGLAGLEDVVTDDPEGDVLLDPGVIEMMFGVEGDALEVISTGGSQPGEGMLQWAHELELGSWFSLEHQGTVVQVQYVWRSARGQLHLLASAGGKNFLVQTRRLASYLQAGLLVPVEDEALTVRATREALAKLHGAPDQLLH